MHCGTNGAYDNKIIVHCGTNDAYDKTAEQLIDELLKLKTFIKKDVALGRCSLIISDYKG